MPWITDSFSETVVEAKKLIWQEFEIHADAIVLLCTQKEMIDRVILELSTRKIPKQRLNNLIQFILPLLVGKYFKETNEIWLIEEKGDNFSTLIHELLHSIQVCSPHREGLVDFLTYKITGDQTIIDPFLLKEWKELEMMHGLEAIKKRLLIPSDCEDF